MPTSYPERVALARLETPLRPLARLSRATGVGLWVKRDDLTGAALSGNKVRKLEFAVADARAKGADMLVTCGGVQSNHCRATALVGAELGLRVHLVLAGDSLADPDGNLLLDRLAGAEITLVSSGVFGQALNAAVEDVAARERAKGRKPYVIPLGASFEPGLWGYIGAAEELVADCAAAGFKPDVVALASGSGGTQAGLVLGDALHGLGARIVGYSVSSAAADLEAAIRDQMRRWKARYGEALDVDALPVEVDDRHIGPGYGQATPAVFETIRRAGREEGLVLDPVYTGKAFHGLLEELAHGDLKGAKNAVFIHTGGMFGLFPQRAAFA